MQLSWHADDRHIREEFDAVILALPVDPMKKIAFSAANFDL